MRHFGPGSGAIFVPATFSGDTVERIAAEACPNFPLVADAARMAEAMNEAAGHLLLSLQTTAPIAEAQKWAGRLDTAARAFLGAIGTPPYRTATRLGLSAEDAGRFFEMVKMVRRTRSAAAQYSGDAEAAKKTATRVLSPAEHTWLRTMIRVYEVCFDREAGVVNNAKQGSQIRGGPAPRFIAAVASALAADADIVDPPEGWGTALVQLAKVTTVASRLQGLKQGG